MIFQNPSTEAIRSLLEQFRTIAVVGLSPKEKRPSHRVSRYMQGFGYRIIPVRPAVEEVLGEQAYSRLEDIDESFELVNIFLSADRLGSIIDSCIKLDVKAIWIQEGIVNEAEALRAQQAGITVIMDRCIYKDYCAMVNPEA
ncbi:MAG: CoA-binding protein [Gammaproteobacteria bacterium]|nr:CoA-binding protein [Gammaproteobacteria bacterium]